jgi:hypothetical protein
MALGKNMKVEKLIPLKPKKGTTRKTITKKEEISSDNEAVVESVSEVDSNEIVTVVDENIVVEEVLTNQSEESNVNVDLDAFFNELDGKSEEVITEKEVVEPQSEIVSETATPHSDSVSASVSVSVPHSHSDSPSSNVSTFDFGDIENDSIKIGFKPSKRKTQKRIFIDIEGDATIKNVELLYSKVNPVFEFFDHVEINMTNIKAVDLSVIQLFHAIRVNYFPQDKHIYLNADFAREDRKLLNTCGFTEFQTQKVSQN